MKSLLKDGGENALFEVSLGVSSGALSLASGIEAILSEVVRYVLRGKVGPSGRIASGLSGSIAGGLDKLLKWLLCCLTCSSCFPATTSTTERKPPANLKCSLRHRYFPASSCQSLFTLDKA